MVQMHREMRLWPRLLVESICRLIHQGTYEKECYASYSMYSACIILAPTLTLPLRPNSDQQPLVTSKLCFQYIPSLYTWIRNHYEQTSLIFELQRYISLHFLSEIWYSPCKLNYLFLFFLPLVQYLDPTHS